MFEYQAIQRVREDARGKWIRASYAETIHQTTRLIAGLQLQSRMPTIRSGHRDGRKSSHRGGVIPLFKCFQSSTGPDFDPFIDELDCFCIESW